MNEQNCGCFGGKFVDFFMGVFQYPVLTSGCNSTYEWILGARGRSYGLPLVCFSLVVTAALVRLCILSTRTPPYPVGLRRSRIVRRPI